MSKFKKIVTGEFILNIFDMVLFTLTTNKYRNVFTQI